MPVLLTDPRATGEDDMRVVLDVTSLDRGLCAIALNGMRQNRRSARGAAKMENAVGAGLAMVLVAFESLLGAGLGRRAAASAMVAVIREAAGDEAIVAFSREAGRLQ